MALLPWASLRDPGYRAADFPGLLEWVERVAPDLPVVSDSLWLLGSLALVAPEHDYVWGPRPADPHPWLTRGVGGMAFIDISRGDRADPVNMTLQRD